MRAHGKCPFKERHYFDIYIDGCSFTNGHNAVDGLEESTTEKSWAWKLPGSTFIGARAGKDNHTIFMDSMQALQKGIKELIIFWTFPERYQLPSEKNPPHNIWHNKEIVPPMMLHNAFWDHVKFQLIFMYTIQEECKRQGVKYTYLTTLPYSYYVQGDNWYLSKIDHNRVVNWPGVPTDVEHGAWVNSLITMFGVKHNCLGGDLKHLTPDGEDKFLEQVILTFLNNNEAVQDWSPELVIEYALSIPEKKLHEATRLNKKDIHRQVEYIYE